MCLCSSLRGPIPVFPPIGGWGSREQSMLRSARVASARPPAPSCPRSARALGSRPFASSHAAHASGDRGARTAAAQQELHCERRSAPALHKTHTLTRPSAAPPCASHGLVAPASAGLETAASPQRAAPCAPYHSHKTSRDNTPHLCPPLQNAGVEWMQNGMGIRRRGPRRRLVI